MPLPDDHTLIDALVAAAIAAGEEILRRRNAGLSIEEKPDHSPVTDADRAAERIITEHLAVAAPGVPVVGEESVSEGRIPKTAGTFFLVDPLDGTKEFTRGGNDFTVNIGLIRDDRPVVGVIYIPATAKLFAGVVGEGAWRAEVRDGALTGRREMRVRKPPEGAIDVVASRSHRTPETDACIRMYEVGKLVSAGSSMKFCAVAEGKADLYPRMGTTMQWDTAAGDAILRAAGGKVVTVDGKPLPYGPNGAEGEAGFRNPWFIATGGLEPILA